MSHLGERNNLAPIVHGVRRDMCHTQGMQKHDTHMSRTTVTAPAEMLAEAKALQLNVSRLFQQKLAEEVARAKAERWAEENAEAIAEYNADVRTNGMLLADQGTW